MDHSRLEMLAEELGASELEEGLWRKFLLGAVSGAGGKDLREMVSEPLLGLLEEIGEAALGVKLARVIERVPDFPTTALLPLILELCGELRHSSEQSVRELEDMLSELATPIIRIWTDVLLMPLIGGLDSSRAQAVVERLLERTSITRAKVVVVDVTGVPMIDTAVGGFLIETFSAVRLLGAKVILTGLKPEVAHTLVKLGIDFRMVTVARDVEDALRQALALLEEERRKQRQIAWGWGSNSLGEGGDHDGV